MATPLCTVCTTREDGSFVNGETPALEALRDARLLIWATPESASKAAAAAADGLYLVENGCVAVDEGAKISTVLLVRMDAPCVWAASIRQTPFVGYVRLE